MFKRNALVLVAPFTPKGQREHQRQNRNLSRDGSIKQDLGRYKSVNADARCGQGLKYLSAWKYGKLFTQHYRRLKHFPNIEEDDLLPLPNVAFSVLDSLDKIQHFSLFPWQRATPQLVQNHFDITESRRVMKGPADAHCSVILTFVPIVSLGTDLSFFLFQ